MGILINYDGTTAIQGGASNHNFGVYSNLTTALRTPATDGLLGGAQMPFTQNGGPTATFRWNPNTFYTIRIVAIGDLCDSYINGVYQGTWPHVYANQGAIQATTPTFVMLIGQNGIFQFKNVKAYQMNLP